MLAKTLHRLRRLNVTEGVMARRWLLTLVVVGACSSHRTAPLDGAAPSPDHARPADLERETSSRDNAAALDRPSLDAMPDSGWAIAAGGLYPDHAQGIAVDDKGSVYVTGYFRDTVAFGATSLTSHGWSDIFVAKIDAATGNVVWASSAGGPDEDQGSAIAIDSSGNVYVTGFFSKAAQFESKTIQSSGLLDIFVAKYSPAGKLLWVIPAGGMDSDRGHGITVDGKGDVLLSGTFRVKASFGAITLTTAAGYEAFAAKISADGAFGWAVCPSGEGFDDGQRIAVNAAGDAYVVGSFIGKTTFGASQLVGSSPGYADVLLFKVSSAGVPLWAVSAGGAGFDGGDGVAVDGSGTVIIAGNFSQTATFGAFTLHSVGGPDVFAAGLSPDGTFHWATSGGGAGVLVATDIAVDALGFSYVTGFFTKSPTFGASTLVSQGQGDVFVARFSPAGVRLSATSAGGLADDRGFGIALDGSGYAYVAGWFQGGPHSYGKRQLTSKGSDDLFVWKLIRP
jgi:hypothetical protein